MDAGDFFECEEDYWNQFYDGAYGEDYFGYDGEDWTAQYGEDYFYGYDDEDWTSWWANDEVYDDDTYWADQAYQVAPDSQRQNEYDMSMASSPELREE